MTLFDDLNRQKVVHDCTNGNAPKIKAGLKKLDYPYHVVKNKFIWLEGIPYQVVMDVV